MFHFGANGAASNTFPSVMDLFPAADAQSVNGVLRGGNAGKRKQANAVFGDLNESGAI